MYSFILSLQTCFPNLKAQLIDEKFVVDFDAGCHYDGLNVMVNLKPIMSGSQLVYASNTPISNHKVHAVLQCSADQIEQCSSQIKKIKKSIKADITLTIAGGTETFYEVQVAFPGEKSNQSTAIIIGCVIGGVVLVIIGMITFIVIRNKKSTVPLLGPV
ncbi:Hypothetical_protein [Hexamita inflata]|uniref:Hypothetical_protein n=1 Tax=Hexamita inflata TaxID=28002 RepID=A0AA86NVU6_9EUKA|nr:Hypothetical protein HINF_LOCUS14226 [Hexamita inflata]